MAPPESGIVHASLAFSAGALRAAGFQHGIADVPCASYASASHLEIGYHGLGDLLARPEPPRLVVCLSDLLAYGAYRRACEAGLRVGEDIVLASFDGNPLNDWIAPWLTAICIPFAAFGPAVVAALGELLAGQRAKTRLLAHHLELRDGGRGGHAGCHGADCAGVIREFG